MPLGIAPKVDPFVGIGCGFIGALVWITVFGIGLHRHGRRCLWLLSTAPAGIFYPILFVFWIYKAGQGDPKWMMP
jgi:hypothetical protein